MTFGWFLLAFAYLVILFWLGRWGDKHSVNAKRLTSHPVVYSLALAIYCTAWTFYGAVGEAARNQWSYLPILLGPILLYTFGRPFLYKLILVSKKQNITTIADFISSRYGKRQTVALLVTLIALLATIPYIALQLKAIGLAFVIIAGEQYAQYVILLATFFIALFSIYFGTQRTDVTEYRHGLMLAIAFESLVKLIALMMVVVAGWWLVKGDPETSFKAYQGSILNERFFSDDGVSSIMSMSFWAQTIVAAAAVICLPRQFHVAIVDNLNLKHLKTSQWLFPLYLGTMAVLIPIIASMGLDAFGVDGVPSDSISPDTYVIHLALQSGWPMITGFVFLGGLSAATAMIIVATLTLSTMVTNDVILPRILTASPHESRPGIYTQKILWIRRLVIAGLLILAFLYHQQLSISTPLTNIGLLAFSLVIHLLPSIVGGLYWKRAHAQGVYAGWIAGFTVWMLWLFMPLLAGESHEHHLQSEMMSLAAISSLFANIAAFILFSWLAHPRLADKIQAHAFVETHEHKVNSMVAAENVSHDDLITVLNTFLGMDRSRQLLQDFEKKHDLVISGIDAPDIKFIQFCERALGGVIGASSANVLINSVVSGEQLNFEQVIQVFDETAQAIKINQSALFASLESLEQGISVIDKELTLVAWNQKYLDMFEYPEGLVSFGTPVEQLVRYNAVRGECGVGEVEALVQKRIEHLRSGRPHKFIRERSDGRVIEMVGNPLPRGGFVTSFNDITEHIELQKALEESNIDLKKRIQHRSEEVQEINVELRKEIERRSEVEKQLMSARSAAEEANASKTRFLALASHDVLQPLNAAKLYLSALKEYELSPDVATIFEKIDNSVSASEAMISTLLDISRLEQGDMKPSFSAVNLKKMLSSLIDEFSLAAHRKGLALSFNVPELWVNTDATYLHRIVRNLLSNALKYTNIGKVEVTAMTADPGNKVLLQVRDTGVGIPEEEHDKVFTDFYRVQNSQAEGVGLGLSVVSRLAEKIHAEISVTSKPFQGSCFSVLIDAAEPQSEQHHGPNLSKAGFKQLRVLCVDDDQENLEAMKTLLSKWQLEVDCATNCKKAMELAKENEPQMLLFDYQLGGDATGLDMIQHFRRTFNKPLPAVLITANRSDVVVQAAAENKVYYLTKPVKPAKLRALLQSIKK